MAKKKKSKAKDTRGYSQGGVPSSQKTTITTAVVANKSTKAPSVSTKTHHDMKNLLHQFASSANNDDDNKISATIASNNNNTSTSKAALSSSRSSDRFKSRLSTIIQTLDSLNFTRTQIELVIVALQYDITVESALDYLCLHVPTEELPTLFVDGELKQNLNELGRRGVNGVGLEVLRSGNTGGGIVQSDNAAEHEKNGDLQSDNIMLVPPTIISEDDDKNLSGDKRSCDQEDAEDEEEKQRKEDHKNWLLQQYEYEEDAEGEDNDNGGGIGNKTDISSQIKHTEVSQPQPLSPEEQQLIKEEQTLSELEADLNNDANNYMRSKAEIKQLANQVKKMKQKVAGLRKKVERSKALQRKQSEEEQVVKGGDIDKKEESVDDDDDGEEGDGGGFFDLFANNNDDNYDEEETTAAAAAADDDKQPPPPPSEPTKVLDFPIPPSWTGMTPQKKLDEVLRKQKLPRARYTKLPTNNGGFTLAVTLDKKRPPQKWEGRTSNFTKDSSLKDYLATLALYEIDSTLPLYQIFPPAFRDLWLSWMNKVKEEKDEAKQLVDDAHKERIDHLLSLIADMQVGRGTTAAPKMDEQVDDHSKVVDTLDNWDDDDDDAADNLPTAPVTTELISSKGRKMQADFVKRQTTPAYKKMKSVRDSLPMSSYRTKIMETMANNPVTILCADTGAGKSTQTAQYIIEQALIDGHGDTVNVICTQPRRVAATSLAERVADEMFDALGKLVGYQIRMQSKRSHQTRLLFCTTGVILRRLQDNPNLTGVTHVIVDEVHERQQQIDVLLIILRQLLQTTRPDLKVILMSATMETELFTSFFYGAPLISVPGRTFPVSSYYLEDLLDATNHIIDEGSRYAIRENYYGETAQLTITTRGGEKRKENVDLTSQVEAIGVSDMYAGYKMTTRRSMERVNEEVINYDLIEDVLKLVTSDQAGINDTLVAPDGADMSTGSILIFLPGLGEIRSLMERLEGSRLFRSRQKFDLIPLHSTLSSKDQRRAFLPSKDGCRKIICATNIAETSVTIPDVVCVIDTGRVREVRRNKRTSTSMLVMDWVPKSSSKQRQGRAGRVQPGLCLKLYSSCTAQSIMKAASEPELRRCPLEEVCMQILASSFAKNCNDFLSQAPQPPSDDSVKAAMNVLYNVGAVERQGDKTTSSLERLTPLGQHLAKLPVDVKLGKLIIYGALFRCIDPIVTIAASLSSKSPFSTFANDVAVAKAKQKTFADPDSDFVTYVNVWNAYSEAAETSTSAARKFCNENYLNYMALREIGDARRQFLELLCGIGFLDRKSIGNGSSRIDFKQLKSSIYNRNAMKVEVAHAIICAGLYPNIARLDQTVSNDVSLWHDNERIYFHRNSINATKKRFTNAESWLIFHEKFGTPTRTSVSTTAFVHPFALILFGGSIDVKHTERTVTVDNWLNIGMAAQTGCILRELRKKVDMLLQRMIERSNSDGEMKSSITMIDGIVSLLS